MFSASPSPTLSLAVGKLRGASTRKQRKRAQRLKTDLRERGSGRSPCRSLPPLKKLDKKMQGYSERPSGTEKQSQENLGHWGKFAVQLARANTESAVLLSARFHFAWKSKTEVALSSKARASRVSAP